MKKTFLLLPVLLHITNYSGSEALLQKHKVLIFTDKDSLAAAVQELSAAARTITTLHLAKENVFKQATYKLTYKQLRCTIAVINALKVYFDEFVSTKKYTLVTPLPDLAVTEDDTKVLGEQGAEALISEINGIIKSIPEYIKPLAVHDIDPQNLQTLNHYFNYIQALLLIESRYFYNNDEKIDKKIQAFTEFAQHVDHSYYSIFKELYNTLYNDAGSDKLDEIKKDTQLKLFGIFKNDIIKNVEKITTVAEKTQLLDEIKKKAIEYNADPSLFIKLINTKLHTVMALSQLNDDLIILGQII
ncbi:MAG: hypothetical protein WC707_06050 [Candidatus Babeliaceae bacterium]|jgi:hypothetical protein